ncbi:hypothetical protein ACEN9F_17195 [Duganella sp. CT11-25]|uniref:hypothetical protein n=1 Tax=unclassified Duganella TaxID=2636909 RepID=UPI0039AFB5F8
MTKTDQTPVRLKAGITVPAEKLTTIQLVSPSVELLIGGAYKAADGMHTYGHMALRVSITKEEKIYDFGRYGKTGGDFSAEGEGILRVWNNFNSYIAGENSYGRSTKGFSYSVPVDQASKIFSYYASLTAVATRRRSKHPNAEEFKLTKDYHGISNNCATMSLAGARIALPGIDANSSMYNAGRGMSDLEKVAARGSNFGFWPPQIFMPADVQVMLETEKKYVPKKTVIYGIAKK